MTVKIHGKDYVTVNERLKDFRSRYPEYSLESEIHSLENGIVVMKATIKNEQGRILATGFASEKESSSMINKTSYIENCETSAWGRCLGNLGIGIDDSVASADEVANAIKNQEVMKSGKDTKWLTDQTKSVILDLKEKHNITDSAFNDRIEQYYNAPNLTGITEEEGLDLIKKIIERFGK